MVFCKGVPATEIDQYWPAVGRILQPAIKIAEEMDGSVDDVHAALKEGRNQLYIAIERSDLMALVTEIQRRENEIVCYLMYLAGRNLKAFMPLQPKFNEWARSLGCAALESVSPKAMLRIMKNFRVVGREGDFYRLRFDLE